MNDPVRFPATFHVFRAPGSARGAERGPSVVIALYSDIFFKFNEGLVSRSDLNQTRSKVKGSGDEIPSSFRHVYSCWS